jgi:hypothetical protein
VRAPPQGTVDVVWNLAHCQDGHGSLCRHDGHGTVIPGCRRCDAIMETAFASCTSHALEDAVTLSAGRVEILEP